MDSYMIHIYRREEGKPGTLVGVVQQVGANEKKIFSTLDELWSILSPAKSDSAKKRRGKAAAPPPISSGRQRREITEFQKESIF
jgi:hypothetical protein